MCVMYMLGPRGTMVNTIFCKENEVQNLVEETNTTQVKKTKNEY